MLALITAAAPSASCPQTGRFAVGNKKLCRLKDRFCNDTSHLVALQLVAVRGQATGGKRVCCRGIATGSKKDSDRWYLFLQ